MKRPLYTLAALAAASALAACGQKAETDTAQTPAAPAADATSGPAMSGMATADVQGAKIAKGTGTVTSVDAAAGTITIDHAPIPEANWPAMTMGFKATPAQVSSVKPGDKVAFDLRLQGGAGEITAISKQ
jgi:Cu/Ag efflux protein CusF